jgi:hypothetical protein
MLNMNICKIATLAAVAIMALTDTVFAGPTSPTPGPVAGVGLASLAIIGGAYWLRRRFLAGKD